LLLLFLDIIWIKFVSRGFHHLSCEYSFKSRFMCGNVSGTF